MSRQQLFLRDDRSVRASREFVAHTLVGWGYSERLDEIRVCVSELATNAVVHGVPPGQHFAVRVEVDEVAVRIEVRDSSAGAPVARSPRLDSEGGRGLLLVHELADAWGDITHTSGKTVWFSMSSAPAPERAE
ncbi:ATP-binding protein [Streptomyces pactum]|uniref:ATP-binding protein n=1 Tax=Streptomyces pactum TaxID=68249 RepID=UPI0037024325